MAKLSMATCAYKTRFQGTHSYGNGGNVKYDNYFLY